MSEQLNTLLILLCRLLSTRRLYFSAHPKVLELGSQFLRQLGEFCTEADTDTLFIGIVKDSLVFEGRNLVGPSVVGRPLFKLAATLNCGGFGFHRETSSSELSAFIDLASEIERPLTSIAEARNILSLKGVTGITIAQHYLPPSGPLTADQRSAWQGQDSSEGIQSPTLIYQALFDVVAQAYQDSSQGKSLDFGTTRSVSEYMLHFTKSNFSDLLQQVHYPDHDSYTVGHSVRVAALAVYLANCFGWEPEFILALGTAGLLHDIGKSHVPNAILYKNGRLTDQEFAMMSSHSQRGARILMEHKESTELEIAAAWGHHVRHDGGGYPRMADWAVRHPVTALLQICDVFEALTASRPYKPAFSPQTAYGIMLRDRDCFHPNLLASFISFVGLYPPGNQVVLSDGRKAMVTGPGGQIDKPLVRITHNRDGKPVEEADQYQIDLGADYARSLAVKQLVHFQTPVQ